MSVVAVPSTCTCGGLIQGLRQCPEHFHLWRGPKRLASIGSIIRTCWPVGKLPPDDVRENAKLRGSEVDKLFGAYVLGKLTAIPAGTRMDAKELFLKLKTWYDKQHFKNVEVQVLLGGEDHGGILDFRFDGMVTELKATYDIQEQHIMQVAGYAALSPESDDIAILHVTERLREPELIHYGSAEVEDWKTMLAHYRMLQRRKAVSFS